MFDALQPVSTNMVMTYNVTSGLIRRSVMSTLTGCLLFVESLAPDATTNVSLCLCMSYMPLQGGL